MSEENKIIYASKILTGTAAVWWFTIIQGQNTPQTWKNFKYAVVIELVPTDHVRRDHDKLRKLVRVATVMRYHSDFRNIYLTIPHMHKGKQMEMF